MRGGDYDARERRFAENDPFHHTTKLKKMLTEVIDHAREDISKISEPKEYEGYEKGDEPRLRQVRSS